MSCDANFDVVVGVCSGLISAAIVASASSIADLLELSAEAVRIAFRTSSCVSEAKEALEQVSLTCKERSHSADSWSTVCVGISEEEAVVALEQVGRAELPGQPYPTSPP